MPDISMCTGEGCPLKETCYRYTAVPDKYFQSYFAEVPVKDGECEYYWENNTTKKSKDETGAN